MLFLTSHNTVAGGIQRRALPCIAERKNINIKMFLFSSRNQTRNQPRLQSHACAIFLCPESQQKTNLTKEQDIIVTIFPSVLFTFEKGTEKSSRVDL